ncbi:hypothetical protein [Arthrobacter sp. A5]|uniref:hypothetical protein n=1 Tax=Arthrobacter sp. A5 TaxID=576926 RepID=UPI003DA92674
MNSEWHEFFLATAGAAAALAGLIIVAMSVNIAKIIAIPSMPSRGAATIGSLVLIVVVSAASLIPDQSDLMLGLETVLFAADAMALYLDAGRKITFLRAEIPLGQSLTKAAFGPVQIAPFLVGGILLTSSNPDGVYWIAAGTILVFIGSVIIAWVLLVEILR